MDNKDKWADVEHHLCPMCGAFMYETERAVCCSCDEWEPWSCDAGTWTLMYGSLFVCAICGDLFPDEGEILPSFERYLCPSCRSVENRTRTERYMRPPS